LPQFRRLLVGLGLVFANGTDSFAQAGFDGGDFEATSSVDSAMVFGPNSVADADFGAGDLAFVVNTGSTPDTAVAGGFAANQLGDFDIASVLGTDSTAQAGNGSYDLAAVVLGDMASALAIGGNHLVDILP
jgi:hypothetical protein